MTIRRGASGEAVTRVQTRLRQLGHYAGPVDGSFGGGTESAVKPFQKARGITADGQVGDATWRLLFPDQATGQPELLSHPVAYRCLALTGSFETSTHPPECFSGFCGDFDGQGISLGALQWNLGQGTLQPLLRRMIRNHRAVCQRIFHDRLAVLENVLASPMEDQVAFAKSIQDRQFSLLEPWRGMLKALGGTEEFRAVQAEHAASIYERAVALAGDYGLTTERGVALMFDILVQNGSISNAVKKEILRDYVGIGELPAREREVARMRAIATRRAAAAKPKFVADVRARKLTIAEGSGVVHGLPYHLEEQFGLRLEPLTRAS